MIYWGGEFDFSALKIELAELKIKSDKPEIFNVELYKKGKNKANSINAAKTLGEPPFVLGSNILFAVKDAVHACSNYTVTPKLDLPATPEKVLMAIEKVRKQWTKNLWLEP